MITVENFEHTLPQKGHVYFECCEISIFLTVFLREAPYLVPYFPHMPTFFVRLAWKHEKEKYTLIHSSG